MSTMKPVQKLVRLNGSSEHLHLWLFAFIFICLRNIPADTHFTIPWLTSTPRAFPFEMFIWILLPRPYLSHPHFVLHWTFSFAMGIRYPPLPLTVLSKDKKNVENIPELCTFTFSAPSSPLQPPLTWSEWSHLYWTTFSSEYNSISIYSTVFIAFWCYLSENFVLCAKLVLLFSLWQEINDCWLNIDVTIS